MTNRLVQLISDNAEKYLDREALIFRDYFSEKWVSYSWMQWSNIIETTAYALRQLGIGEEDKIAIFSANCPGILTCYFAAFYCRAVSVPIYATSSQSEMEFILNDADINVIFVGDQRQYRLARNAKHLSRPDLKIVIFNPRVERDMVDNESITWRQFEKSGQDATEAIKEEVKNLTQSATPDDLAFLIYTSGTTGVPKGVMITHDNLDVTMDAHVEFLPFVNDEDLSISFLPYSHIFELGWTLVCLTIGIRVAINYNPKEIQQALTEIHPTCMCSVPRFWEKVYTAINDKMTSAAPLLRSLMQRAINVGIIRNVKYRTQGKKAPAHIEAQYKVLDKMVLSKIRAAVGITNSKLFPTAGAALSPHITEFLIGIGLDICIGYGLSETTATVTAAPRKGYNMGTIGVTIPGVSVKIGENDEILVKGRSVMKGYYHRPEETTNAFTPDGWLHTGDAGRIDNDGQLIITERIKDLFKTSNGKYVAPQALEASIGRDKYIDTIVIIGDQRKFVSAVIVPDFAEIKAYAKEHNIRYSSMEELVRCEPIHELIAERIQPLQQDFADYEKVKRFVLLPHEFKMETGELTNTLKVRRSVVNKLYAEQINALYAD